MRKHTKIIMKAYGWQIAEDAVCEVCGDVGVDVHHIHARGMGGSKKADTIENLMCLCRSCHVKYGDKKEHREMLIEKHHQFCARMKV